MPEVLLRETGDAPRAEDAALRLGRRRGLCWLDGGLTYGHEGRWSFVGVEPVTVVARSADDPAALSALATLRADKLDATPTDAAPLAPRDVPAWIGWIGYDAHGFAHTKTQHTRATAAGSGLCFARYDALLAYDHETGRRYVVGDDERACDALLAKLRTPPLAAEELAFEAHDLRVTEPARHVAAIAQALGAVRDGDVYEINLARLFSASFAGSALGLYLRMRAKSPVPLGLYCALSGHALLGRSMERYLRYDREASRVWTSPIKGTLARAAGGDGASLVRDPKEHAEHAMVVDLMRNDLSRVSVPGSVQIDALMRVEPFAGLYHLVSTISGRVRPECTLYDVLSETFPPGSVSGTPKQSALSLIERLEPSARGLYTGAYGFIDRAGGCSLAVAIRTAVVTDSQVRYWSGGGIVAHSDPERELAETELKARMFVEALTGP